MLGHDARRMRRADHGHRQRSASLAGRQRPGAGRAGFVRVGATLQSASHANVFAAGDLIVRDDTPHPHSGVYAVRAGPVLARTCAASPVAAC